LFDDRKHIDSCVIWLFNALFATKVPLWYEMTGLSSKKKDIDDPSVFSTVMYWDSVCKSKAIQVSDKIVINRFIIKLVLPY
jgi:hypothetical protein